jgi:hypothetical protein
MKYLILLFSLTLSTSTFATLCSEILENLRAASNTESRKDGAVSAIMVFAGEESKKSKQNLKPQGPFDDLFIAEDPSGKILKIKENSKLRFQIYPIKKQKPWKQLSQEEQLYLVSELAAEISANRRYDQKVYDKAVQKESPQDKKKGPDLNALFEKILANINQHEKAEEEGKLIHEDIEAAVKEYRGSWILSPSLFIRTESQTEMVCRHANEALGALLVEVGVPLSDVRVVHGRTNKNTNGHAWLEVKIAGQWRSLDATPILTPKSAEKDPLMRLLANIKSRTDTFETAKNYRNIFANEIIENYFEIYKPKSPR